MRKTKQIFCGDVSIGGGSDISIQSMTNTDTRDVEATLKQIAELQEAGCQIVRLAIPDGEAADAFGRIRKKVSLPLVADIHFDYRLAIEAIKNGADKVRINPGNIGSHERVQAVAKVAKERGIPLRIGVNGGSLEKDILTKHGGVTAQGICESALNNIKLLESMDYDNLIISIKSSDVKLNYETHLLLAEKTQYPFHIGITEAGTGDAGKAKSAIGIGSLLLAGIGDTIRVSLTGNPVNEVLFAREILKSLHLKKSAINLISCPTCARCSVNLEGITDALREAFSPLEKEREKLGLPSVTVAAMGCEVNGPGEAKGADLGVACGKGKGLIFQRGEIVKTVNEEEIVAELIQYVSDEKTLV